MRSSFEQQIFKPMSNRTRTKPHQIYLKLNTNLAQLQDQVSEFNTTEQYLGSRIKRHVKHSDLRQFKLKSMTQPKFQALLLNCQLPQTEKNASKVSKLQRKISTKTGKEFKNFNLTSSTNSFMGFKSIAQSKLVQSRLANFPDSKVSKKDQMKSTVVNAKSKNEASAVSRHHPRQVNLSMTESVLIQNNTEVMKTNKRSKVKTLKEQVKQKQMQLQNEWQKTQRYRGKVSSYLGQDDLQRVQRSTFAMTRIVSVIDKVKRSRTTTTAGFGCDCIELDSTQTL